ncbi:MAG: ArnT family glycosyltransferase, partial [Aggregatilineales bacterium]
MQAIEQSPAQASPDTGTIISPAQIGISIEVVAYAVLLLFALCVHIADLDTVPLSDLEAMQALPAWHMLYPDAPGTALTSDSPVTFWLQAIGLTMLGGNEFAARLPGLLGGMLLVLLPLLFRQRIGQERAFLWTLLLVCSPIVLLSGRFTQPAIWNSVFALLGIWAVWRYIESRTQRDMLLAGAAFTGLVFLSGAGGVILAILLALSALLAVLWTAYSQPEDLELETPGQNIIAQAQSLIASIAFTQVAMLAFLLIFVVSTGFMLHPSGLSMVGEVFAGALTGITQPAQPGTAFGSGLWGVFFYNPLLIVMTLVTAITFLRRERLAFFERFLFVWMLLAALMLLLYRGAIAGDALWFVLPATALFTGLLRDIVEDRRVFMFWLDDTPSADDDNLP